MELVSNWMLLFWLVQSITIFVKEITISLVPDPEKAYDSVHAFVLAIATVVLAVYDLSKLQAVCGMPCDF